ncbi:MAG: SDR family NAD(P)-dependent oxidoreductase [Duganella sp.]
MSVQNDVADIAVIGMACRFPGASDYEQFWQTQHRGVFSVAEVPAARWDINQYYSPRREDDNKTVSKWGGFMTDIDRFDAGLFKISPREAELMDPQQRIMLELAWSCVEDAGYAPAALRGSDTGVYLGVCNFDYKLQVERAPALIEAHMSTGVHTTLIPNRISYEFDWRGPSIPFDTACSSSLVALAEAVHALRRGDCSAALVGGVSVLLNPTHFISFSKAGMLSPQGVCRSFDEAADGYVRGEGAGLIMLKPLAAAQRDGDKVYGLVRGVAVNHGGKVATVTSPNPFAQARCLEQALRNARLSPADVQYIEAHGTGTPKGDPIEMHALIRAYASQARAQGIELPARSCAIGSVKTSIGHLEAAAGIAGIIKVLLAMRHEHLPPLLHFKRANPRIRLDGSPFYFLSEAQHWQAGDDGVRRAGISSFGFGGVNAHVVLEQYVEAESAPRAAVQAHDDQCLLFLLSAKTADSLARYARALAGYISAPDSRSWDRPFSLPALAHSLQQREVMEERLAIEAIDAGTLVARLLACADGQLAPGCWRAHIRDGEEVVATFKADPSAPDRLADSLRTRDHAAIAQYWIAGGAIDDWAPYFAQGLPAKLTLPEYAFAHKRYWHSNAAQTVPAGAAWLHPLLHANTSTLTAVRFSTCLSGAEFFLADHRVNGSKVLPGVAYLEMARAAVQAAAPALCSGGLQLSQVVWSRPLVAGDQPLQLELELSDLGAQEGVRWVVQTGDADACVRHGEGRAVPLTEYLAPVDLAALRTRLGESAGRSVEAHYLSCTAMGIEYGPAHRAITALESAAGEVLARVAVSAAVQGTASPYVLHPGLFDAALQACLAADAPPRGGALVPFALDRLLLPSSTLVAGAAPLALWAWVRRSAIGDARVYDIDLCDDEGQVYAGMRGLSLRVMGAASQPAAPPPVPTLQPLLLLTPTWRDGVPSAPASIPAAGQAAWRAHHVVLAGFDDAALGPQLAQLLHAQGVATQSTVTPLEENPVSVSHADIAHRYHQAVLALFKVVLGAIRAASATPGPQLFQLLVPDDGAGQLLAGLAGLLRTARLEQPALTVQLLRVDARTPAALLHRHLLAGAAQPASMLWRFHDQRCLNGVFAELPASRTAAIATPWKEGGVYLITGGAGALGQLFAREIVRHLHRATLVLTGRTARPPADFDALRAAGAGVSIEYHQLDLADAAAVAALVDHVVQCHGGLNGVLHCAGQVSDNYLLRKDGADFAGVLAPKVDGVVHLDAATRALPLDLFVLFSSTAGALGNMGQADYAAANGFMDQYAHWRRQSDQGQRGRTISINWPLWQHGGMRVDAATAQMLEQRLGMTPLQTDAGLQAFYLALASGESQVLVMAGNLASMRASLLEQACVPAADAAPTAPPVVHYEPRTGPLPSAQRIIAELVAIAAGLLKLDPQDIDSRTQLSEYGFDSIAYTGLANRISDKYGIEVSPALFFDFQTIASIADYLLNNHAAQMPVEMSAPVVIAAPPPATPDTVPALSARAEVPETEAIAIIGMSGSFPMAPDLATFWRNLDEGRDCISEIPKQRWDWQAIHADPANSMDLGNRSSVKWGGFIEGMDEFDPLFFGISPREALLMDPQQRLLMTHIWQAIEDAGYAPSSLSGSATAIFVGTASTGYDSVLARAGLAIEGFSATGVVPSVGPNRMSYLLNLHGPSEPVETACSSSLVAIHRAVLAMRSGDCEQAIVGGVNTIVAPALHISFSKAGMLAHDGRCKTFSSTANGYVRGEGVGMLFLKKLSAAEADGDHIYGVIRGSAENHGGRATSLTAPNASAQAQVIRKAWERAGIAMDSASCLETHGTGTPLGDPVEINGIKAAFQSGHAHHECTVPCALASVKTNIGHLELAAGVAGVIKVLLQMRHQRIVANLHCTELNPHIDLAASRFHIPRQSQPWSTPNGEHGQPLPRRAGVSSFGFGGVNAHVVLEEYPQRPLAGSASVAAGPVLVPLSAKTPAALRRYAQALLDHLAAHPAISLAALAYTLQVGRDAMDERLALAVHTVAELEQGLRHFLAGDPVAGGFVQGQVGRSREALGAYADDEDLQATMALWLNKGKVQHFLGLWVKGVAFDWNSLYRHLAPEQRPRRISAPTYPFAREQLWPVAATLAPAPAPAFDPVLEALMALGRGAASIDDTLAAVSAP